MVSSGKSTLQKNTFFFVINFSLESKHNSHKTENLQATFVIALYKNMGDYFLKK